jgi:uncharacterized coiled-coil DUF342 family protein/energy-coupling factor transporter ATP-binding protein EcfA2
MTNNNHRHPFPGLRAFEPEEDYLFFGREKETDELRRRLRVSRFLAVIGSSGSGKSSLVKSGLIPSLHAGFMAGAGSNWRVVTLRPGEDPMGNLVEALRGAEVVPAMASAAATKEIVLAVTLRDSSLGIAEAVKHAMLPERENVLVVVDQFEELFRFKRSRAIQDSDNEAVAFVKLLLDAAHQDYASVFVVITMRSEFIGDCMPFPGLPEAINEGQYLIPRMTRDEMRAAITKPVAVGGAKIAPRLVVRLLNEVGGETDHLPVLQHALMRTWEAWARDHAAGEPLDVRHYEAIGTMKTALSQHAEEAYSDLKSDGARSIAERLFKTITETTEDGRGVRRPTSLGRIAAVCGVAEASVAEVVETFRQTGRAFLQPPQNVELETHSIIDISHESLMRLWERLVGWTKEEARSTDIYTRLSRSARRHEAREESLWRNPQLQIGSRWRKENHPTAAWVGDEKDFARSMRFLERSRRAHLMRRAALALAVLAVIAGLLWWVHLKQVENRRLIEEKRVLNEKLLKLQSEQQAVQVQVEAGSREVEELRERNAKLRSDIAGALKRREAVNLNINALRESNRNVEGKIGALNIENEALARKTNDLNSESQRLAVEWAALKTQSEALAKQRVTLNGQKDYLTNAAREARERSSSLLIKAEWLGYRPSPKKAFPKPDRFDEFTSLSPAIADIFKIPRDVPNNDALRRQIEELQRQLDELQAARAKQVDEADWLKKENALLESQLTALLKEVRGLERTQAGLAARSRELSRLGVAAERQNQKFKLEAATAETTITTQRDVVGQQRKATADAQQINNALFEEVAGLQKGINRANEQSEILMKFINETLNQLVEPEVRVSADADALRAVSAFRLAPFDPDDLSHPSVYNALWRALNRLDEKAARDMINPSAGAKAKIGTATSAALAQAVCARVKRGFAEDEWKFFFPAHQSSNEPDFNSPLGNPCASLPPTVKR